MIPVPRPGGATYPPPCVLPASPPMPQLQLPFFPEGVTHITALSASTASRVPAMPGAGMMAGSPACDAPRKTETLLQPQTLPNFDG
jgi:hypothetical protein